MLPTSRIVQVVLPQALLGPLDYSIPEAMEVELGSYVKVPFRQSHAVGIVWSEEPSSLAPTKIRSIDGVLPYPAVGQSMRQFLARAADYTFSSLGGVVKMALPIATAFGPRAMHATLSIAPASSIPPPPTLSDAQQQASHALGAAITSQKFQSLLLDGVTGSGKTEVYAAVIDRILAEEQGQVLLLLPEICLTAHILSRLQERFRYAPIAWHSSLGTKQRRQYWQAIVHGEARLVVGARSALFLPFRHLKLIIVDEEHEASYKQEEGVLYHARDMAVLRAHSEQCVVLLASATPSLETLWNVKQKKCQVLTLPDRFAGASLPAVELVDMRSRDKRQGWLSPPLCQQLAKVLDEQQQALLFLNRRGYAPLTLCRSCGHRFICPHCQSWLVEHRKGKYLECHHCLYRIHTPSNCPECDQQGTLIPCGPGVERIAEEVELRFPKARLCVVTRDTVETADKAEALLAEITAGDYDILVGTQMIAKGHHFPLLKLVGVIDADLGLSGGDLRAAERTYQLLHQVSGRAGRTGSEGKVLIQTFHPQSTLMQALVHHDRDGFLEQELAARQQGEMPPFTRLVALVVAATDNKRAKDVAQALARTAPIHKEVILLGPAEAPISLLRGKYRYRLLLKTARNFPVQQYLRAWLPQVPIHRAVQVKVDIDPYQFL
jgi:primosomal protein N' (replication factor Y)